MTQYSYSRVDLYDRCPYHFKLKYLDKAKEIPDYSPTSPLILGHAIHSGIEKGSTDYAVNEYINAYPMITDAHINEIIKIEYMLPKVFEFLSQFDGAELIHEYEIDTEDYKGFVDLIVKDKDRTLVIDFKYSNSIEAYKNSCQLHIYKYYLDQAGFNVTDLGFLFIEKVKVKYKKNEDIYQFRKRLRNELDKARVTYVPIEYDERKVLEFDWAIEAIETENEWDRNPHGNCFACNAIEAKQNGKYTVLTPPNYLDYIQNENGEIIEMLPKNERRDVTKVNKRVLWMYGAPFSGKTWFANSFPNVIMLNTDGNIKFVDAPYVSIVEKVEKKGRILDTTLAWDVLEETVIELQKGDHEFETVVVDLIEDVYEAARIKTYEDLGIEHESDNSFKAWDIVTTKFLNMVKRIANLPMKNIIFISHEDTTKDVTKRSGDKITSIQPNLREKVALKLAGMVDIVGRVVTDGDERKLVFKSKSYVFSGGRIPNLPVDEIDLDYDEFIGVYEEANKGLKKANATEEPEEETEENPKRSRRKKEDAPEPEEVSNEVEEEEEIEETAEEEVEEEKKPRRRRRSRSTDDIPPGEEEEETEEEEVEEAPKRRRRRRSRD
ncbi:AAA family ATPase [Facklamia sp. P12937]|uniref:AAA family ATPase n=1 Tax=Facklamia sp. P12937 TaxID=3421949 RepID=UPI003D166430